MAQILKNEVRERILRAATDQLTQYGEAATMRQIAKAAGVTPGNLYRYYESKESLVAAITAPVVEGLAQIVQAASGEAIVLGQLELPPLPTGQNCIDLVERDFYQMMRQILSQLARLHREYPRQAGILLHSPETGRQLIGWFRQLVDQAITRMIRPGSLTRRQLDGLADAEHQSFCAGISVLLERCSALPQTEADQLIDHYLRLHVTGLTVLLRRGFASGAILPEGSERHA